MSESEKATELELAAVVVSAEYDLGLQNCYGNMVRACVEYANGKAEAVTIDDYTFTKRSELERVGRVLLALAEKLPEPEPPKPRKPRAKKTTAKKTTAKRRA